MSLPADGVNANTLAETTTIPTGKKLIFLDPDTNEGGIITLENLTKQILSNLTSQTFNLDQGNKTLLAALNELNSKGKTIETTIGAGKEYTVSLEDHSIYMLVYYELGNGNINDGSVNCAVIVSRQADEKTGGIYTTATSSEENISLENNILKITAGTWWVRVCIKKL